MKIKQAWYLVSTHAPARGATAPRCGGRCAESCFNPRTRTGCDEVFQVLNLYDTVSTHAPARGATQRAGEVTPPLDLFQPTHPHGVRHGPYCDDCWEEMFQPTHPHGVRPARALSSGNSSSFQPTHPHGVRPGSAERRFGAGSGFNPRTRTGCDADLVVLDDAGAEFQPTHPHGVRR